MTTPPAARPESGRTRLAERILGRPLTIAALVLAAGFLATWLPHFLTWPLWIDPDTFAMMAHAWEEGRPPYHDIVTFNFPGAIYLAWLLGKSFGWDRLPIVLHVFDAALVVAFGAALLWWSRRTFGRALPGAIGFVALLWVYLSLDFVLVVQRDWHGPALALSAILLVEAGRTRWVRPVSALLFAAAFVIRPHVVLFLPAALSAILEDRGTQAAAGWRRLRPVAEWAAVFAAGLVVAFTPLFLAGIFPDFLRSIAIAAPGGVYSLHNRSWDRFVATFSREILHFKYFVFPAAAWFLAVRLRSPHRALARTWAIAAAGAFLFMLVHPFAYGYLEIPIHVVTAVNAAVVVGLVLSAGLWSPRIRLAAVLATAYLAVPGTPMHLPSRPEFCSVSDSLAALRDLAHGETPASAPSGARGHYLPAKGAHYEWDDYRRLVEYLRTNIRQPTRVANLFRKWCVPAFHVPTDTTSVFPTDQGPVWAWLVDASYEHVCSEALETAEDSVVVWVPGESVGSDPPLFLVPEIEATVRRLYVFEVRFGAIEVWKRR